jgi:hypothetical protein
MARAETFAATLARGRVGESAIARWLREARGCAVLPVYETEIDTGKGPRLLAPRREIVAPDMLGLKGGRVFWIEAKHKGVFSWHRKTGRWTTGIDVHHYYQYLAIAAGWPHPVYLLFLHTRDSAADRRPLEPWPCPTGLFGGDIRRLCNAENHRSPEWGRHGMVYWAHDALCRYASLDEVRAAGDRP